MISEVMRAEVDELAGGSVSGVAEGLLLFGGGEEFLGEFAGVLDADVIGQPERVAGERRADIKASSVGRGQASRLQDAQRGNEPIYRPRKRDMINLIE